MQIPTNCGLLLAALVFAVLLIPSPGWASTSKPCPPEPAQGVPIVSGETYYGPSCTVYTTGDVDSFQFNAAAGTTWSIVAAANPKPADICMALYAPGVFPPGPSLFSGCTSGGDVSVATNQNLTAAGLYTIIITELENMAVAYGLTLERLAPPPPDAVPLIFSKNVTGEVSPLTAQDAFTFDGNTAGAYQITASKLSGTPYDVCFNVYQPGGNSVLTSPLCTFGGTITVTADLAPPPQNGTYVVMVYAAGNAGVADYNLEVSCLGTPGTCPSTPKCVLEDALSYASGTLTMNLTIGTPYAATWNGWLVSENTPTLLWSVSQPITEPTATVTKTQAVAASGTVGVLSTLTTPTRGIACSSWSLISTGTP
jgi:hypothetical protein